MTGRVPLARRNLFADRRRAALATLGVAAALVLVLLFDGLFAGALRQATAYQRGWQADLVVSQLGVRTMHMSASALPPATVGAARAVPGVAWAEPIRYTSAVVHAGLAEHFAYVIGYDTATGRGGPRRLVAGRPPTAGQAVIDRLGARRLHVVVGRTITVLGRSWVVSGLSAGETSIVNTTVFVTNDDFAARRGPAVSYVLVGTQPGAPVAAVGDRLAGAISTATVQTRAGFVRQEGNITRDMSADILRIVTVIGLLIALAVIALTLFTLTLARLRDYGVLKALGAPNRRLAAVVATQAAWSVVLALAVAVLLAIALGALVSHLAPAISITILPASVARTGAGALVVGALGSIIPLRRVARVDPASVFRRAA
jgi:putative ABC transport system permease protein